MVSVQPFINRWKDSGASERANFHSFVFDLCDLLGLPRPDPATDQTTRNDYTFERPVTFDDGACGSLRRTPQQTTIARRVSG